MAVFRTGTDCARSDAVKVGRSRNGEYGLAPRRDSDPRTAGNGAAILQTLQKELFVVPVTPQGGKVARVNAVSAAIESGHVYVPAPHEAPWVYDYLEQWSVFPNAPHDDMVDASSQALSYLLNCPAGKWSDEDIQKQPFQMERLYEVYGL